MCSSDVECSRPFMAELFERPLLDPKSATHMHPASFVPSAIESQLPTIADKAATSSY